MTDFKAMPPGYGDSILVFGVCLHYSFAAVIVKDNAFLQESCMLPYVYEDRQRTKHSIVRLEQWYQVLN